MSRGHNVSIQFRECILIPGHEIIFNFYIGTICYDDACHLLRYAQNPKRLNLTDTSKRIGGTTIVVDKFHFRNHVDEWCKKHCNLDEVNHFI